MRVISLDIVMDKKSLGGLICKLKGYPGRLAEEQVIEDRQYLFLERVYRGDCGHLDDECLKVLFAKLPKGYITAEFNGENSLLWVIRNRRYTVLKECVKILSELYNQNLSAGLIPKEDSFWQSVYDGSLSSWANSRRLSEIEILKKALGHAIEQSDDRAIFILLNNQSELCVELQSYRIPVALTSEGGMKYVKKWVTLEYEVIDIPSLALTLSSSPELIDMLLLPRNHGVAIRLLNIELVRVRAFTHIFSPKQIRAIGIFSRTLADYLVEHKMSKCHAFLDGLYYCDMSLLWKFYNRCSQERSSPVQFERVNGGANIVIVQPTRTILPAPRSTRYKPAK